MVAHLADVINDEDDDYDEEDDVIGLGPNKSTMSKRTPSILVTDARSSKPRSTAPFAGHAAAMNVSKSKRGSSSGTPGVGVNSTTSNSLRSRSSVANNHNTNIKSSYNQIKNSSYGSSLRPSSVGQRITSSIKDKLKYSPSSNSKYDPHIKLKNNGIPTGSTLTSNNATTRSNWARGNPISKNKDRYKIRRSSESSRFSDISLDNILLNSPSVPSGRREQRGSHSSWDRFTLQNRSYSQNRYNKYRNTMNTLPSRTSKISQKLVLIPEDTELTNMSNSHKDMSITKGLMLHGSGDVLDRQNYSSIRTQLLNDHESYRYREGKLARLTAYNIADGFNIRLLTKFLKHTHEVSPRLYDDCLYVPYVLPLLPGKDGFRIKSNVSKKIQGGKTLIEKMLDTSEQRDHHFEYYSGVETVSEANPKVKVQNLYDRNLDYIEGNGNANANSTIANISDPMNDNIVVSNIGKNSRRSSVNSNHSVNKIDNNIQGRRNSGNDMLEDMDQNRIVVRDNMNPLLENSTCENINDNTILENSMKRSGIDDSFDPSEPQLFAEESPLEQEIREREELLKITSPQPTSENLSTDPIAGETSDKDALNKSNNQTDSKTATSGKIMNNSMLNNISAAETKRFINQNRYRHAELFIFHYGVIVFWNFTEEQEKDILGDLAFADEKNLIVRPLDEQEIETEEFQFEYDKDTERPRIFNDVITLRSGDHFIKMTLSYAIAQSTKLSRFESRISPILHSIMKLPKRLALHGTLGLKREQLLKKSGKLFKLRVDVNLSSNVLDTPEFFWSVEPSLHPLYIAMREYLEIDKRVTVVNDRCKVFLEFFDICVDSVAEKNIARVTLWFIIMIVVGVIFSVSEIMVRYNIIHN